MKLSNIIFLLLFSVGALQAQTSHFSRLYGTGSFNETAYFVKELSSGGYILAGNSIDTLDMQKRYWGVIRIKANGDTVFTKKIYAGKTAGVFFMDEKSDGKIIIVSSDGTDKFMHLLEVDTNTNLIIDLKFEIQPLDTMQGIPYYRFEYLPGEGILIWGNNNFTGNSIIKTDLNGKLIWNKSYLDSIPVSNINHLARTNSGYLISGNFTISTRKQSDAYTILIDSNGNVLKQTFANDPFKYNQTIDCIAQIKDGGFIEAGTQHSPQDADYNKIFKLDKNLDTIWSKKFYFWEVNNSQYYHIVVDPRFCFPSKDGGVTLFANGNSNEYLMVKFDKDGYRLWSRIIDNSYVGKGTVNLFNAIETSDGGFGFVGSHSSSSNRESDYFMLKINSEGTTSIQSEYIYDEFISIYPNPSTSEITIKSKTELKNATSQLYNLQGQLVVNFSNINGFQFSIYKNELPAGLYLLKVNDQSGRNYSAKVLFE